MKKSNLSHWSSAHSKRVRYSTTQVEHQIQSNRFRKMPPNIARLQPCNPTDLVGESLKNDVPKRRDRKTRSVPSQPGLWHARPHSLETGQLGITGRWEYGMSRNNYRESWSKLHRDIEIPQSKSRLNLDKIFKTCFSMVYQRHSGEMRWHQNAWRREDALNWLLRHSVQFLACWYKKRCCPQ
jgi:hypothetical protein